MFNLSMNRSPKNRQTEKALCMTSSSWRNKKRNMSQSESPSGQENHERKMLNIVLLGQAGTGKSASGNRILQQNCFKSEKSSLPVTTVCKVQTTQLSGKMVSVIDTPDFFHDNVECSNKHVKDCKMQCVDGFSVYLLVIQIDRFTKGKREILKQLEEALGEIKNQTIVLFTHGENLVDVTFDQFIQDAEPHLKEILSLCGDRYHLFRNTSTDRHQVKELMEKIYSLAKFDLGNTDLKEITTNTYSNVEKMCHLL